MSCCAFEASNKKILPFLSELRFVGFQDERIKKKIDIILQSLNPINPNSEFSGFSTSLTKTKVFVFNQL
jgi:hypothetical protein